MADNNATNINAGALAEMFSQNQQQPVAKPQHENQITYNSSYDTSTDEYGAPIQPNQPAQQQFNQFNQPAPQQQPNQLPNNPEDINMAAIQQLFDPNVDTITQPNTPTQNPTEPSINEAFAQLAQTLTAAQQAPQQQIDPVTNKPINPVTAIFNEAYGEDIDFSAMMATEGDPAEINTQMQQSVRQKMEAVYANSITQSLALSQQLIERKFTEFAAQQQAEQSQQTAVSQMRERLPFTQQPEYTGLSQMLLTQAMQKTNNNVQQSVQLVEQLFRLNNPALFNKPNSTRFGSPTSQQGSSGPAGLTLDNFESWIN